MWPVQRVRASAGEAHEYTVPAATARLVRVVDVTGPALVLGSSQPDGDVDRAACAAAGIAIVRRRSGGGAVLVEPGRVLWVDVVVPPSDPLWHDDVGRAFWWLGRAWAGALRAVGVSGDVGVNTGPMVCTRWSRMVCFAGQGPGEVTVDGAKVVGMSQRRSRAGALFHCAALIEWDPAALSSLLVARPPVGELAGVAAAVRRPVADLDAAFLGSLPTLP